MIDAAALRAADIVVVDTEEHLETVQENTGRRRGGAVGAPTPWHEPRGAVRRPRRPLKVVFYGLYTPLQGTPVIGEALGRLAGAPVEVTMIAAARTRRTKRAAAANQSVRWLGWVPAAELPALVPRMTCASASSHRRQALRVVPTRCSREPRGARSSPPTPAQRRVLGDAAVLVPPGDPRRWPTRASAGQ